MAADGVDGISLEEAEEAFMRSLQAALSTNPRFARYVTKSVHKKLGAILASMDGVGTADEPENSTVVPFTSNRPASSALRVIEPAPSLETRSGTLFSSDAHAKCLYTPKRGIMPWIAEFVILRMLQVDPSSRWQKRELHEYLSEKFEIGTAASFTTRLHNMRLEGTIAWVDRQHGAPLRLTAKGVERADELMAHRQSRVSEAQYECLRRHVSELKLKPRAR